MNDTPNGLTVLDAPASTDTGGGPGRPRAGALGRVIQGLPTLLVLGILGGVAYWGHHTGWTISKFSSLTGAARAEKDDWCGEHGVPESLCVECNPGLLPKPKDYGWCSRHGVQDCPLEHPDVAQVLSEPRVARDDLERARRALDFARRPENSKRCKVHPRRIQFASQGAFERAGVGMMAASTAAVEETVAASGEITYDPTRLAALSAPVPGRLWRVDQEIGQAVRKGDVLALVGAAEVGKAKAEFLTALAQVELRTKTLERLDAAGRGVARRQVLEAEAALREAQVRLVSAQQALVNLGLPLRADDMRGLTPDEAGRRMQFLGLPPALVNALDPRTTTGNLVPVRSPLDGVVVSRKAVAGEMVDASKTLFVVADTGRLWLTLNVRQEDLKPFREKDPGLLLGGKLVRFQPDGTTHLATGTVSWVSTAADEKTRTLQVRVDLANPGGWLRANTFGAGAIVLREEKEAVVVPSEAVHWDGNCHVVFVRDKDFLRKDAPKVFHVRVVRPGVKDDRNTEIIAGVLPGEVVAAKGSGVLRAELLKNNLGEG
jgi:cobalt-zinc-cadmium efflux system membrane fusion protein